MKYGAVWLPNKTATFKLLSFKKWLQVLALSFGFRNAIYDMKVEL